MEGRYGCELKPLHEEKSVKINVKVTRKLIMYHEPSVSGYFELLCREDGERPNPTS